MGSVKFSNQELDLVDDSNSRVILVKRGDSAPSVPTSPGRGQPSQFPTPPSGGRPNRPVYVQKSRTAPKVVDQGLGAVANPARAGGGNGGGGGAAELDDQCPAPKKEQSQESKTFDYNYRSKKKKKPDDQCSLDERTPNKISEKFDLKAVKKLIKTALANQRVKKEYQEIKKRINDGVNPIDIGKKSTNFPGNKY